MKIHSKRLLFMGNLKRWVLMIEPEPSDAKVHITCSEKDSEGNPYPQVGNSIRVPDSSFVSYTVEREGYVSTSSAITLKANTTLKVALKKEVSFILHLTQSSASASFSMDDSGSAFGGSTIPVRPSDTWTDSAGKYYKVLVPEGSVLHITVSLSGYESESITTTVDKDTSLTLTLKRILYTLTINPTPSNATVKLTASGYTQSGNSITVPTGTSVSYTVSASNYNTRTGSLSVTSTQTLSVVLSSRYCTVTLILTNSKTNCACGYYKDGAYLTAQFTGGTHYIAVDKNTEFIFLVGYSPDYSVNGATGRPNVGNNDTYTIRL